jgi:translation elongation factor EF-1alpha
MSKVIILVIGVVLIYEYPGGIILNTQPAQAQNGLKRRRKMTEKEIGTISDFFAHIVVAGIDLSGALKVGDKVHVKGHTTDLEMDITSMQIDNKNVTDAKKGQSIGVKVPDRVRPGDIVYKVV